MPDQPAIAWVDVADRLDDLSWNANRVVLYRLGFTDQRKIITDLQHLLDDAQRFLDNHTRDRDDDQRGSTVDITAVKDALDAAIRDYRDGRRTL